MAVSFKDVSFRNHEEGGAEIHPPTSSLAAFLIPVDDDLSTHVERQRVRMRSEGRRARFCRDPRPTTRSG